MVVGAYGPLLEHLTRRFAVSLPVAGATISLYPAASVGGILGPGAIGLVIAGFGVGLTPFALAAVAAGMLRTFYRAGRTA